MVLYNKFLIDLINNTIGANIVAGEEFNHKDVFLNAWDEFCAISYEDYLAFQNEESFLKDIAELDNCNVSKVGIVIGDVTELTVDKATKLTGKARIYIFNPEEERRASNNYFYINEYIEARKKLDQLMTKIDLSEPDELKKAKQIFVLLRKQYIHAFPKTGDILAGLRYSQNMYGCLCLNQGVCAGGANTFRAMCSLAHIQCRRISINVTYNNNNEMVHSLNQICVNGEWGIVDVELFKDTPEQDDSLFFCGEDYYKKRWRDELFATYTVAKDSCPLMPTNISVSREYIAGLDIERSPISEDKPTSVNQLMTLATYEIVSGKTTVSNLDLAHDFTEVKEELENDTIQ